MTNCERVKNGQSFEACAICEVKKKEGIHLYNIFLCMACEKALIHTEASDPLYHHHIEKLRKMNISETYS